MDHSEHSQLQAVQCPLWRLDDACLANIIRFLEPLPDLFNLGQTCWHLRRLTADKHLWLVVCSDAADYQRARAKLGLGPGAESTGLSRHFTGVAAAVQASRPGDVIWMAPQVHELLEPLRISHPLHLLGGGSMPDQTVLSSPKGATATLELRATCRIANLTLRALHGACIAHRQGQARVESCVLYVSAKRVATHCLAPIVTYACTSLGQQVLMGHTPMPAALRLGAGNGRIAVSETQLHGGATAVHCRGTGTLRDVRVVYPRNGPLLYWLAVDCIAPGYYDATAQHMGFHEAMSVQAVPVASSDISSSEPSAEKLKAWRVCKAADSAQPPGLPHTATLAGPSLLRMELSVQNGPAANTCMQPDAGDGPVGLSLLAGMVERLGEGALQALLQRRALQPSSQPVALLPPLFTHSSSFSAGQAAGTFAPGTQRHARQQHGDTFLIQAAGTLPAQHDSQQPLYNHLMLPYETMLSTSPAVAATAVDDGSLGLLPSTPILDSALHPRVRSYLDDTTGLGPVGKQQPTDPAVAKKRERQDAQQGQGQQHRRCVRPVFI